MVEAGDALDFADDVVGLGDDLAQAAEVAGGDPEAVEQDGGVLGLHHLDGEGVANLGDGDLDGLAVFELGELDEVAVFPLAGPGMQPGAVERVVSVEAAMEVAEVLVAEGDGAALQAVGLDVSADR